MFSGATEKQHRLQWVKQLPRKRFENSNGNARGGICWYLRIAANDCLRSSEFFLLDKRGITLESLLEATSDYSFSWKWKLGIVKLSWSKVVSYKTTTWNLSLNKLITILALSILLNDITVFTFFFLTETQEEGGGKYCLTVSVRCLCWSEVVCSFIVSF